MRSGRLFAATVAAVGAAWGWRWLRRGGEPGILDATQVRRLYDDLAPRYDGLASIYRVVGSRQLARRGIAQLGLRPGDTVVDLGCGSGVNLRDLVHAVGPTGRVIGVDLSSGMLDQARARIADLRARNVELVQADVRAFAFPDDVRGVLSTFAMEMVPEHDEVVRRACAALSRRGGAIATMGLREPPAWPRWAVDLGLALGRPFGASRAYAAVHPWESIDRHADRVSFETIALGAVYLCVGWVDEDDATQAA